MEKTLLDVLKNMQLPIKNLNLFEEQLHTDLEPFLKNIEASNSAAFLNELTLEVCLQKLKSFKFQDSNSLFKLIPIEKKETKNLEINYNYYQTEIGKVFIASTSIGICYVAFETEEKKALPYLLEIFPKSTIKQQAKELHQLVLEYIKGNESSIIPLHIKGTTFQFEVWNALLDIPKGSLTSYAEIAKRINKPKASRAVGTAIGTNPISLLIPCHRVIQTSGKAGGYMWGLATKYLLIAREGNAIKQKK